MLNYSSELLQVHEAADRALDNNIQELQRFCRIRSRRWEPDQMREASEFLVDSLRSHGAQARSVEWPDSHPYVLGGFEAGADAPVLLHYNHYDVEIEPAGDEKDLLYPPFAAEIHGGKLYARGVADDKGPLMSRIHAARAFLDAGMKLPVSVKFLFEGKEELHSPGMGSFVAAHQEELVADAIFWENSWFDERGRLLLKLSEKGLLYVRLSVSFLQRDGSSQNSAVLPHASDYLVRALASLRDAEGRVNLPGFYESVETLDDDTIAEVRKVSFDAARLSEMMSIDEEYFPDEASTVLRTEPTLTITSVRVGEPIDSVTLRLPAQPEATLEFRLVPGQDPADVLQTLREFLNDQGLEELQIEVMGMTDPYRTDMSHPFVRIVQEAGGRCFDEVPAIEPLTPLVGNQGAMGGPPIVGIGIGGAWSASDPNQHIEVERYREAVHHLIEVMWRLGQEDVAEW